MKIEGRNAVLEAIKAGKTIDRLVASRSLKDAGAQNIINEAKARGIKINFMNKEALDRESQTGKHQGFIAMTTDFKYCELSDILNLAREKDQLPLLIILDGIEDPHNMGSIIRSAECLGAHGIVIGRHRAVNINETVIRVSSGAAAHMLIARVSNINNVIRDLKDKEGIAVVAADMDGTPVFNSRLDGALAIVVGGEGKGVSRLTRELCDSVVSIPMTGKVNSLNSSVASALVLLEAIRQRTKT